ncbi:uncharacterized protein LOC142985610 [Anticarsia gemmatalis]|uniref:uncharacterized protein LOC142985610 n=1 Tax=Anticarsia gemmatalis TaxID=129554 RepID=UPI003F772143
MAEPNSQSAPVFIDVAAGPEQYPISVMMNETPVTPAPVTDSSALKDVKIEVEVEPASEPTTQPLAPYLEIQPRKMRCTECNRYTAENAEKMLRHIRKVHRGENPFQCYMCDYSTYNKSLFEEHVRIHQGIKPFKCSHCPYRSASKKNTKKHELIHRKDNPRKCKHCGFIARHLRSLMCHISSEHSNWAGDDSEKKKSTLCPYCNKKFEDIVAHEKSRRKCSECDIIFCNAHLLKKHNVSQHGGKLKVAKGEFVCAICKWQSNIKPRILLHLIHHPNQTIDESVVDVRVLKECGIVGPGW